METAASQDLTAHSNERSERMTARHSVRTIPMVGPLKKPSSAVACLATSHFHGKPPHVLTQRCSAFFGNGVPDCQTNKSNMIHGFNCVQESKRHMNTRYIIRRNNSDARPLSHQTISSEVSPSTRSHSATVGPCTSRTSTTLLLKIPAVFVLSQLLLMTHELRVQHRLAIAALQPR